MMRVLAIVILSALLISLFPPSISAQETDAFLDQTLNEMTVEEKVGQLFITTFVGDDVGPESDIARLIAEYRIGGVALLASNGNFTNQGDTPLQVATLTNSLQELAFQASQQTESPGIYIPLFIAVDHEGDGYPYTRITNGLTTVPNNMAIGATWREENAEKIGQIVGRELRALGINMLLGPSLDVLNQPRPGLKGDLGTRTFGGDPYWVGKMGQAYIHGVHLGSEGQMVTVAKHFPGNGGSDRSPDEEVATVDKSLQELRRIELAPFFAVTGIESQNPLALTDGLMSSHIRYRGFQGNIRQLTRPISFDAQGLQALMALPELAPWREEGVMVSDSLGVPAVRKYYDPQLGTFPHKRIAQEAFLAGNDLLLLSQFALTDEWTVQMENIEATIEFFREKYTSDATFQQKVDSALRRILRLKRRLYPDFSLAESQVETDQIAEEVGQGQAEVFQVAREAITLIYPGQEELADRLPSPPLTDERILIFTDAREAADCPSCQLFPLIPPTALEEMILQRYGPAATGQIIPDHVNSLTFAQLKEFLQPSEEGGLAEEERAGIEELIQEADWILFAMLDLNSIDYPQSDAIKVFLKERSDSLRNKKIVALAYNAPYYLDTTEISKLTAYYGIYSKTPPFLEASVRALFQEFQPKGASPVSVVGINYDVVSQMEPDPEQAIEVLLLEPSTEEPIEIGATLHITTSLIVDKNGHQVPDGTPVAFSFFYPSDSLYLPPQEVTTQDGVAEVTFLADRPGQLEIKAVSGRATSPVALTVIIPGEEEPPAEQVTGTPPPTATLIPTPTAIPTAIPTAMLPTPIPTPTSTPTLIPTPLPSTPTVVVPPLAEEPPPPPPPVDWSVLLFSLGGMILAGGVNALLRRAEGRALPEEVRLFLFSLILGLVGYLLFGLGWLKWGEIPGLDEIFSSNVPPRWGAPTISFLFALAPITSALWRRGNRGGLP
jgi:beta-N-acetylhexosaminidase